MLPLDDRHLQTWVEVEAATKGLLTTPDKQRVRSSLQTAFATHYEAVVCDIDGTLTASDDAKLPTTAIVDALRGLLRRGVRVILATGRGATAATLIKQILGELDDDNLSRRYMYRLACLTHNGATLIEVVPSDGLELVETPLKVIVDPAQLHEVIASIVRNLAPKGLKEVRARDSGTRIVLTSKEERDALHHALVDETRARRDIADQMFIRMGQYGSDTFTIDINPTTKGRGLTQLCQRLGIREARCLRLGDRGSSTGNDYDLLKADTAFSAGEVSGDPSSCHVVVDGSGQVLTNAAASEYLLNHLRFAAPLASQTDDFERLTTQLLGFEREVSRSARRERARTREMFATSMGALFNLDPEVPAHSDLADLCYDPQSGAVHLENWEMRSPASREPLGQLFRLPLFDFAADPPDSEWAMYSDTAVLLRGPMYYRDWTQEWKENGFAVARLLRMYRVFISHALGGVAHQEFSEPSLTRLKLLLGVMDNVRDMLLKCLHLAYALHSERDAGPDIDAIDDVAEMVSDHTDFLVTAHIANQETWRALHEDYAILLEQVLDGVLSLEQKLSGAAVTWIDAELRLFRSRECDHFLENVTGVRFGLEKHLEQERSLSTDPFSVVGLVYGGSELPFITKSLAALAGLDAIPGLLAVSTYTRADGENTSSSLSNPFLNLWVSDVHRSRSGPVLLADDNMTTARSLQRARDSLEDYGYHVAGAIVIRYPGVNRLVQMRTIDASIPDPDVFMTFVRGLIAPAPYARLVRPRSGSSNRYLDETGVFNKSNDRIERYVRKATQAFAETVHGESQ